MGGLAMNKLFLGSMALAAMIAGPAMAADMPVKVKAPPPVVLYDWSGAYVGFNIGGVWADVDRFYPQAIGGALSATIRTEDVIYGFHAGAQWQWGQWVLGVETSLERGASGKCKAAWLCRPRPSRPTPPPTTRSPTCSRSARGSAIAWDRWMIFGTGGYASGGHQGAVHFHQHRRAALPGLPRPEPA